MARGKMSIPSSSDESSSDDEGEGNPSVDELVEAVKFFQDVCTKQKAQLKTLKNKLISSQNDYKGLLENFEAFANLNCELSTKIEQLESSATSIATDDSLIKNNEKLKAKLPSSQDAIENLLGKMEILSIHNNELTTKVENIGSTLGASLVEISEIITEGQELLQEIHSGACGHHAAPRALVGNAFRQGFYWPTAVADATRIVRTCEGCQFYAKQTHLPTQALQTIPITWPFAVWGLDLVGPLQKASGGYTHLLVAIDKFSKWVEVRPLNSIRSEQAVTFFTNIIHRFGVPNSIITDNGT
jgi:FtsZ-binding cell division protein ZapB